MTGVNMLRQSLAAVAFSGFLAVGVWAQGTNATASTPDPDVVQDQRDINHDRRDVHQDTRDIHHDRKDLRNDRKDAVNRE